MSGKLGVCSFCNENVAKYKCPKCAVAYCSLGCFKSESHREMDLKVAHVKDIHQKPKDETYDEVVNSNREQSPTNRIFQKIAQDPKIRAMLKYNSLQLHLLTLIKILDDPTLFKSTNEQIFTTENKHAMMNLKLNDLRAGGIEQNELVEEFILRVAELYEEYLEAEVST